MASSKYIEKVLADYGYTLCLDTSFLSNCNEVLAKVDEPISITKEVFHELDQLKNAPANGRSSGKKNST